MDLLERLKFNSLNVLIAINIIVFVLVMLFRNGSVTLGDTIEVFGAFNVYFVQEGYLWLFITAAFLHFDFIHIIFNMFALFQLGSITKEFYGNQILFLVYIITAIASHVTTYVAVGLGFFSPLTISIGASGAIFGLLGFILAGITKTRRYGTELPFSVQQFMPLLISAAIISLLPGVNWAAHIGGFLMGVILSQFIAPVSTIEQQNARNLLKLIWILSVCLLVLSYLSLILHLFLGG